MTLLGLMFFIVNGRKVLEDGGDMHLVSGLEDVKILLNKNNHTFPVRRLGV
jgi:hypothetical protein